MGLISDEDWWKALNKLPDSEKRRQIIEIKKQQEENWQKSLDNLGVD
jgi:hypothetical protein